MATPIISSDSSADYAISPEQFLIKLRKNLDGVGLSHDTLDNNWEVLRRTLNDLHQEIDEITAGSLSDTTTANLFVNKIADDIIDTNHIKDDAVTGDEIANGSIVTAHIKSQQITSDLIADGSITTAKVSLGGLNLAEGITVNGVQVVDVNGNITGPVSLSAQQLIDLKGERGEEFKYGDFTTDQLALLKGDAFVHSDFTEEQLAALKGPTGASPTFSFVDGALIITNT